MSRLLAGAQPLPAVVLGAIAVAVAATGVGPVASGALGFAAVGALVGVAPAAVFFRSTASALQDELIRLADEALEPPPAPGRFGPLGRSRSPLKRAREGRSRPGTQPPREAGRDSGDARRPRERDQHDPDQ